jgi:hypothetical protein
MPCCLERHGVFHFVWLFVEWPLAFAELLVFSDISLHFIPVISLVQCKLHIRLRGVNYRDSTSEPVESKHIVTRSYD